MAVGYNPRIVTDGLVLALDAASAKSYDSSVFGQQTYTSSGTYSWTCPLGVTSVSVVCIGGGGGGNGGGNGVGGAGGGGGGGLGYKNNISVTPGQSYTVVVGGGGAGDAWDGPPFSANPANDGGDSYFIDATTVKGGGGGGGYGNSSATGGSGGTYVGDGGGNGYSGGTGSSGSSSNGYLPATGGGGGSTGTYTGNATTRGTSKYISSNCTSGCLAGNGTGQGLLGTGSSGSYGRGGGANMNTFSNGTSGYTGAVRIMWGTDRSYPSTGVADQSSSTAFNDVSGKGNIGTLNGPTFSSDDGGYLEFDGTDDTITVDDSIRTTVGEFVATSSNPFSISAWFKPDTSDTGDNCIFAKGNGHGTIGNVYVEYSGTNMRAVIRGTATDDFYTTLTNSWHEVTICWDGTTFKSYVNGLFVSNLSVGTATSQDASLTIGNSGNGTNPFKGKISNVRVYTKGLTATEVEQNYNATKGRYA